MQKILLFQVGTMQYGIALSRVMGVRSAKTLISAIPEGRVGGICQMDGRPAHLFDLAAIFEDTTVSREGQKAKVILAATQDLPAGLVVSNVNQVVSVSENRVKLLSPVFRGASLACFPEVMKHSDSLILMLNPDGLRSVAGPASGDCLKGVDHGKCR